MKITVKEYNVNTNEESIFERDATPEEIESFDSAQKIIAKKEAEELAKKNARSEILAKLGLTEDEVKVLFG